jgi:hypothetical protein
METQRTIIARQDQFHGYEYRVEAPELIDDPDGTLSRLWYWTTKRNCKKPRRYIYPGSEHAFVQAMNALGYRVSLRKYRQSPIQRAQSMLCRQAIAHSMDAIKTKRRSIAQLF